MRFLMTCMLLCGAAVGYTQSEESPVEVTIGDESEVVDDAFGVQADWGCGCSKNKDNKPK